MKTSISFWAVTLVLIAATMTTLSCSDKYARLGKSQPSAMLEDLELSRVSEGFHPVIRLEEPPALEMPRTRQFSAMLEDLKYPARPAGDVKAEMRKDLKPSPIPEEPKS